MTDTPVWTVHERAGGGYELHRSGKPPIVVTGFATRERAETAAAVLNRPPARPASDPDAAP